MGAHRPALLAAVSAGVILAATAPSGVGASDGLADLADVPVSGLPEGVPAVALQPEPGLAPPEGWPFPSGAPRTSGTGRLAGGAFHWTDFLYDDCGALGVTARVQTAPCMGGYRYPPGAASGNGADIFRVGIGLDSEATYWRVDWVTLVDPGVPIAAFGLDTDDDPMTGTGDPLTGAARWPGNSGVGSPGLEQVLVLSSRGAWLIDAVTAERRSLEQLGGSLAVTPQAGQGYPGSFVLRLPHAVLQPGDVWTVRLAAGLANAAGDDFATVGAANGQAPGAANVYNVGFRTLAQEVAAQEQHREPVRGSYWMEAAQAPALLTGEIGAFSARVEWDRLAARDTTPEPQPTGWSNRWLVSQLATGDGTGGLSVSFPGRLQTYGLWVPAGYDPLTPAAVMAIHHSATQNHNQWFANEGRSGGQRTFLRQACDQLGVICFAPNTRGGGATGAGELDFWETWADVARSYTLDPERVYITGASLGGTSTRTLAAKYPDLFAASMPLASSSTGSCCANLEWVPVWTGHETAVSVFLPSNNNEMRSLGYRFRDESYPLEQHFGYISSGQFMPGVRWLGIPQARRTGWSVPDVDYRFSPGAFDPRYSAEEAAAYWLRELTARTGSTAGVRASTDALPHPLIQTTVRSNELVVSEDRPSPAVAEELVWTVTGATPPSGNGARVELTNIATATIMGAHAGLDGGEALDLAVTSDGASRVTLTLDLPSGVTVGLEPAGCATVASLSTSGLVADVNAGTCALTLTP